MSTEKMNNTNRESQIIKVDPRCIDASPFQSRKVFDPAKLREMVESVREHGLIQPPLVRAGQVPGRVELIVGERRVRACVALELTEIAVLMSEVADAQAEGMVLTENIQREGLTPAEEAHAFDRLLKLRGEGGEVLYTQGGIAQMIGKDFEYVAARLKLLLCPAELVTAVDEGLVSVSTAMLVGRVPDAKARVECAKLVLKPTHQEVPMNYQQTKELIRAQFVTKLSKADFDLDDPSLVPVRLEAGERCQGGACTDCPFRSGVMSPTGNPEGVGSEAKGNKRGEASENLCTLPRCHRLKLDAAWAARRAAAAAAGGKVLDDKEAKKVFAGRDGAVAWDSKLVAITGEMYIEGVGYKPVAGLLKGASAPKVILAQHPETKKVVLLVDSAELKAAAQAAQKVPGEQGAAAEREAAEREEERAKELRKQKIDKLALEEGVSDLLEAIYGGRVKLDEHFYGRMLETVLGNAGSDGLKFVADTLKLERDKRANAYELDKPLKKWIAENCVTVPQLVSVTVLAMLGRGLHWNGVADEDFRAWLGLCGIKVPELERRAKALLDAPKAGKGNKVAKKAVSDSTEPLDWSADKEADKTKAADARAKAKGKSANTKDYTAAAQKKKLAAVEDAITATSMVLQSEVKAAGGGPSAAEIATGIQDSKIGKPEMWNADDVEAGAKLLRAKTHKVTDLIGPSPIRKETIKLKNYNAVRLRLMRKAGKVK